MKISPIYRYAALLAAMFTLAGCGQFEQGLFETGVALERARAGLELKTIRVAGTQIAYLEREGNGEAIVLLHGFGANKDSWDLLARYLPKKYRLLALDLAGHGDRRKNMNAVYDVFHLLDDFSRIVRNLGLHRFHLAGNSLGGYVATLYAARNPRKLISLGLFASAGVSSPTPSDFQLALAEGQNPILVNSAESFDRMLDFLFYKKPFMPWPVHAVLLHQSVQRYGIDKKIWHDIWENRKDVTDLLPGIRVPVLVVWGDKDRILNVSSTIVYQRYLPEVKTVIIKNCGHALIYSRAEEAAAAYAVFLGQVRAGKSVRLSDSRGENTR